MYVCACLGLWVCVLDIIRWIFTFKFGRVGQSMTVNDQKC